MRESKMFCEKTIISKTKNFENEKVKILIIK